MSGIYVDCRPLLFFRKDKKKTVAEKSGLFIFLTVDITKP